MPTIKSNTEMRNNYNEIDDELNSRLELYSLLQEGLDDIVAGRTQSISEAIADIRATRES